MAALTTANDTCRSGNASLNSGGSQTPMLKPAQNRMAEAAKSKRTGRGLKMERTTASSDGSASSSSCCFSSAPFSASVAVAVATAATATAVAVVVVVVRAACRCCPRSCRSWCSCWVCCCACCSRVASLPRCSPFFFVALSLGSTTKTAVSAEARSATLPTDTQVPRQPRNVRVESKAVNDASPPPKYTALPYSEFAVARSDSGNASASKPKPAGVQNPIDTPCMTRSANTLANDGARPVATVARPQLRHARDVS
mmetsp:Transcript_63690/g.125062  ORF Transcript_63690/g.125062 Transcript_63690/m.125062 type:complete len:255 (-) Transcript_63690:537-1301(-)